MMKRETERDQTECWCDDWVAGFHPALNRMEPTSLRSPFWLSVSHCSPEMAAEGCGTDGWNQVQKEHSEKVALSLDTGVEETRIGKRNKG